MQTASVPGKWFGYTCLCVEIQGALPRRLLWVRTLLIQNSSSQNHPKCGKNSKLHPGVIFVSLGRRSPILRGKMLNHAIRRLCFTQILTDSDHTASKIFSPNTTAGRCVCLRVFNDIFTCNSSGNEASNSARL